MKIYKNTFIDSAENTNKKADGLLHFTTSRNYMIRNIIILCVLALITAAGCKEPYLPPAIASTGSYLVVEGVINSGADSTIINLSHTVSISSKTTVNPELGAVITIESPSNGKVYPCYELGNGKYFTIYLNLDNTVQYRLRIETAGGKEYLSDLVGVKSTPPIDSVGFTIQNGGIQIYSNAHDATNNTRYYRWDYQETWQFHAKYGSTYITNGTSIVPRSLDQIISSCFANNTSSTIVLGSSAKLAQDVIYQNPITTIPSTSEKIETKYSILLKQYALTGDAFNFWTKLKKNTEQLGSIFDAQPSNLTGNIHCTTNPAEPVIGYVSICNIQTKRIFITRDELPAQWITTYPYTCEQDSELTNHAGVNDVALNLIPLGSYLIPTSGIYSGGGLIGYFASSPDCVDCTLRGYTKQPDFWR